MFRKSLLLLLAVFSLHGSGLSAGLCAAQTLSARTLKAVVFSLGVGADARVAVKLKDGTRLEGYISRIDEDRFVVVGGDGKAITTTTINYTSVARIKRKDRSANRLSLLIDDRLENLGFSRVL